MSNSKPREFWIRPEGISKPCVQHAAVYSKEDLESEGGKNEFILEGIHVREVTPEDAKLLECFDEMLNGLQVILSNWPPERDGMDNEGPLPVGVSLCRKILKEAESLRSKS